MSGKRAFLELLKQEGVEIMFGNPGTTELPLMDALAVEHDIRYVLGLQEAALMAMADGYAQASGKLAVLNLHVAPGLGNAMGMLYDAQKAGSPILVTAGQHDPNFTVTEPILWADLPTIARPLVKWSAEVHRLAELPRSSIAPPRPRWRRRPGRCSCRCPATSSRPRRISIWSRRRGSRRACAATPPRSQPAARCSRRRSGR